MARKKKTIVPMTSEEKDRIRELSYMSKRGQRLLPDEMAFLAKMCNLHPEEYNEIQTEGSGRAVDELKRMFTIPDKK
jgi:hypothetical protein